MGISSADLAGFLNSSISGAAIDQYREKRELIEIRLRGDRAERVDVGSLASGRTDQPREYCSFGPDCPD